MTDKIICNASYSKLDTMLDVLFPGVIFHRKNSGKVDNASEDEKYLISSKSLNNKHQIDDFLEEVNALLCKGDYFVGCADYQTRKLSVLASTSLFSSLVAQLTVFFKKKNNSVNLSKMEILGRIYRNGFTIRDLQKKDNYLYFIAQKNISL